MRIRNIRVILFLSLILVAPSFCRCQSIVKANGPLKVDKNNILNTFGKPAQLRGVSLSWSVWGGRKYYNADVVDWLVKDFKVSLIRVAMAVEPDSGYLQEPEKQMALITGVVDAAIKNGIYVIIDWHDHHADQHVAEAKVFFSAMAKRYAGIPNVIYEIWNEPEQVGWETIKNYALELIPTIRAHDAENIIVVGAPRWDQDVDLVAVNPIEGQRQIAYSFHFYASDPQHQGGLRQKADFAMQQGLALFITEWGVGESNGDGMFDLKKTGEWMEWMERNKLSWTNWNLTDKAETTALLKKGASTGGQWQAEELSKAGRFIREKLRELHVEN